MHHEMERMHHVTMAQQLGIVGKDLSPGRARPMVGVLQSGKTGSMTRFWRFSVGREALSGDEVKSELLASLQSMLDMVIPTPDAMLMTRSQQNEFT